MGAGRPGAAPGPPLDGKGRKEDLWLMRWLKRFLIVAAVLMLSQTVRAWWSTGALDPWPWYLWSAAIAALVATISLARPNPRPLPEAQEVRVTAGRDSATGPAGFTGRMRRTQFWGRDANDDRLVRQVIAGTKTATVCPAHEHHLIVGEFDDGGGTVGELVEVYDGHGRLRCRIRLTEIYPLRFGDVPERLWRAEGCASAEEFQEDHRQSWPQHKLTPEFSLIATHFELVSVVEGTP